MKSVLKLFAVSAVLLSQASYAWAQHKETVAPAGYIEFTPVRVALGMPKDRTIALLSEHYSVSPWKGGDVADSWTVSEKTGNQDGIHIVTGGLSFANGVLIGATRFWYLEDSAYSLAHTMSLLIDHLQDEGFTHCTISTRKAPTPNVETEVLGISCGQKGIIVQADQARQKEFKMVQVVESLEAVFSPTSR
jgi:hypothetical protein